MSAGKRSISAPAELFAQADLRAAVLGYNKLSHYIQKLIEDDVARQTPHVRGEGTVYPAPVPAAVVMNETFSSGKGEALAREAAEKLLAGRDQPGRPGAESGARAHVVPRAKAPLPAAKNRSRRHP